MGEPPGPCEVCPSSTAVAQQMSRSSSSGGRLPLLAVHTAPEGCVLHVAIRLTTFFFFFLMAPRANSL
jgi:hypothetical protein